MKTATVLIEGMTCGGCVAAVERVLARLPSVTGLKVEVGEAQFQYDEALLDEAQVRQSVTRAGFSTEGFERP
ncbi:MAG: heavy-metal-associated domain-containing protein [Myxococcales bacterium]|nr:heavy-metal-associated domain-containing protein [Myxococcales bacterium]